MVRYNQKFFSISAENMQVIQDFAEYRSNVQNRAKNTVQQNIQILKSYANVLGKKSFRDTTEQDLMDFFKKPEILSSLNTRDIYGTNLILFYRWLLKLKKRQRPKIMEWFEYTTSSQRERQRDPNQKEKYFITRQDYETIIEHCITAYGHDQALFETLYLSGGRPHEVASMKIKDVEIEQNHIIITFNVSKTRPRKVPLSEPAEHLMRWLAYHPFKDNPNSALWLTASRQSKQQPLQVYSIATKLEDIKQRTKLRKTITPHCFRKTRATIMFTEGYDDKEMSELFGWSFQTVVKRREEYDLRDFDELKKKIFAKPTKSISYDALKKENDQVVTKQQKEIDELKNWMDMLAKNLEIIMPHWTKYIQRDKIDPKEKEKLKVELLSFKKGVKKIGTK